MKKQIENRTDVEFLVHQFYAKIRADEMDCTQKFRRIYN
jgi:truncated hemoglobin YjbI